LADYCGQDSQSSRTDLCDLVKDWQDQPRGRSEMVELLALFRKHFNSLQDRFASFLRHEVIIEGWFKGELLVALDTLLATGTVAAFDREVRVHHSRIDLCVEAKGQKHWVELKYWLNGSQRGSEYSPAFYFGDPTEVGVTKDVAKLRGLDTKDQRWLLILVVSNPGTVAWTAGLAKYNSRFQSKLAMRSNPADFPPSYFLGLIEVE
jgi:sugar fermentation stimulation protein SfsA